MPKLKTYKAAAKRFKITGRGKLRRHKQGRSHLRSKKSKRTLRSYRMDLPVASADQKRVRRLLGSRKTKRK